MRILPPEKQELVASVLQPLARLRGVGGGRERGRRLGRGRARRRAGARSHGRRERRRRRSGDPGDDYLRIVTGVRGSEGFLQEQERAAICLATPYIGRERATRKSHAHRHLAIHASSAAAAARGTQTGPSPIRACSVACRCRSRATIARYSVSRVVEKRRVRIGIGMRVVRPLTRTKLRRSPRRLQFCEWYAAKSLLPLL